MSKTESPMSDPLKLSLTACGGFRGSWAAFNRISYFRALPVGTPSSAAVRQALSCVKLEPSEPH